MCLLLCCRCALAKPEGWVFLDLLSVSQQLQDGSFHLKGVLVTDGFSFAEFSLAMQEIRSEVNTCPWMYFTCRALENWISIREPLNLPLVLSQPWIFSEASIVFIPLLQNHAKSLSLCLISPGMGLALDSSTQSSLVQARNLTQALLSAYAFSFLLQGWEMKRGESFSILSYVWFPEQWGMQVFVWVRVLNCEIHGDWAEMSRGLAQGGEEGTAADVLHLGLLFSLGWRKDSVP